MTTAGALFATANDEMLVANSIPNNRRQSNTFIPSLSNELQLKKERVRQKYAQRNQERKIEMYFKALEVVRQKEENQTGTVTFKVNYATQFGQDVFLCGNIPELGSWDLSQARKMIWSEGNNWICKVDIPSNVKTILYKYIVTNGNGSAPTWEWGNNHQLKVPVNKSSHDVVDVWGCGDAF